MQDLHEPVFMSFGSTFIFKVDLNQQFPYKIFFLMRNNHRYWLYPHSSDGICRSAILLMLGYSEKYIYSYKNRCHVCILDANTVTGHGV